MSQLPLSTNQPPADDAEVHDALKKSLPRGTLARIPRHPRRRDIILGLISLSLERRYPYGEIELNDLLSSTLSIMDSEVDHVTCRRYLVDFGFLKRDRAGSRYYLNFPKLESTLALPLESDWAIVLDAWRKELGRRAASRRARGNSDQDPASGARE